MFAAEISFLRSETDKLLRRENLFRCRELLSRRRETISRCREKVSRRREMISRRWEFVSRCREVVSRSRNFISRRREVDSQCREIFVRRAISILFCSNARKADARAVSFPRFRLADRPVKSSRAPCIYATKFRITCCAPR